MFQNVQSDTRHGGNGFCDLTTRANLQVREILPPNGADILMKLADLRLRSPGAGADHIRSITANPLPCPRSRHRRPRRDGPHHAHWPLVFMLMLTQAGIGLMIGGHAHRPVTLVAVALFFAGMAASILHLGQPLKAWRFFLGLRTSWLSREILAFSLFAPIPLVLALFPLLPDFPLKSSLALGTSDLALPLGLAALFTSVMIYHDTRRVSWRFPRTALRFFGTVLSFIALGRILVAPSLPGLVLLAISILAKMIPELRLVHHARKADTPWSADLQGGRLLRGPLATTYRCHIALAVAAAAVAPLQPWLSLAFLLRAELLDRQLFFQSVHAPKMPGNFGPPRHPRALHRDRVMADRPASSQSPRRKGS